MATQLKGHERWDILGNWKTSMSVEEMAEYIAEKNGGDSGVTIEEVNSAIDDKIASVLPQDAEEGSTLEFRGGKWVAVPPETP